MHIKVEIKGIFFKLNFKQIFHLNQKKSVSLVILLLGVLGSIDARKHKRNCQTTQPACDSATTTTQTPTCTAGSSTTAVATTAAPLKVKGEPCKMNSDCLANLACDIRIEPRQYICSNIQNGTCDTWLDCANNLQCVNGQCGCYV